MLMPCQFQRSQRDERRKRPCHILLVEDNPEDRAEFRQLLRTASERRYSFSEVETGAACLQFLAVKGSDPIDCMVLDYHLPDYEALELIRQLRSTESLSCPVVVVTGASGHVSGSELLQAGAHDFVSKRWLNAEHFTRSIENTIERYRLERRLKLSEARFKAFLNNSAIIAWMKDTEGRYSYLSDNFQNVFGLPQEQALGKTDNDLWPAHLAKQFVHNDRQVLFTDRAQEFLEQAVINDIPSWWLSSKFPFTESSGKRYVGGLAVNVTARFNAEKALQVSLAEYRALFETAGVGNAEIDLSTGRFVRVNPKCGDLLGYRTEELLKMRDWLDLTYPDDRDALDRLVHTVTQNKDNPMEIEIRWIRKDKTVTWVHLTGTLLPSEGGHPMRLLANVLDISARRQAEDSLKKADRSKDEFLAMLGHELRNPLNAISMATHVLDSLNANEMREQMVTVLNRNVQHMTHLVDDLLDVSRITRGLIVLQRQRNDLGQLIQHAVEPIQSLVQLKHHTLTFSFPDFPVYIDGDPNRLTQIFSNLLGNAVKYTDSGGTIDVFLEVDDSFAIIRIKDDGIGLAPELLPFIFDLFTQADHALPRSEGGLGIGLTLVRKLVMLHGGAVSAHSNGLNEGSEFTVRLPRVVADSGSTPSGATKTTMDNSPNQAQVLIIDDNDDSTASLVLLLKHCGYRAIASNSAAEGLLLAQQNAPDVIILDIGLPEISGYEVAKQLRSHPETKPSLLIALSGYPPDNKPRSELSDFDHYLIKPLNPETLQKIMADHLTTKNDACSKSVP